MKNSIRVTVLMIVRNGIPYIQEAVQSILNQSLTNFNFIIIDNASDDGTAEYLNQIEDKRVIVKAYDQIGIVNSLNYGFSFIDTEYTAIMDADDISYPQRLEEQVRYLDINDDVGLVGSSVEYFVNSRSRTWTRKLPTNFDDIKKGLCNGRNVICHPTVMLRSELLRKINGYRNKHANVPDLDLFIRLSKITKLKNLSKVLLKYRFTEESFTAINLNGILIQQKEITNKFVKKRPGFLFESVFFKINLVSQKFYRMGLIYYLGDSLVLGFILLFLSGLLNPLRGLKQLLRK